MRAPSAARELAASRAVGSFCSQPATEVAGYSPPPLRGSRWRTSPLRSIYVARSIALAQDDRVFLMAGWPKDGVSASQRAEFTRRGRRFPRPWAGRPCNSKFAEIPACFAARRLSDNARENVDLR